MYKSLKTWIVFIVFIMVINRIKATFKMVKNSKLTEIQKKAEACMKDGNYTEAFIHWTHAIKVEPDETKFYQERSRCFLLQEQYYFALQDAETMMRLNPESLIGHSRKAEILYETRHYSLALPIIQKCFSLAQERPEKDNFLEWSKRCKREIAKQKSFDAQFPFVGAAVGIVVSTLAVVWDFVIFGHESLIASPILKVLLILAVASVFYWLAQGPTL